jgi:hypothetical protein
MFAHEHAKKVAAVHTTECLGFQTKEVFVLGTESGEALDACKKSGLRCS